MNTGFTKCETCGKTVEATKVDVGFGMENAPFHYVHCGWGHEADADDVYDNPELMEK